jgi:3-oxoacyl-ACP reductase-like protein
LAGTARLARCAPPVLYLGYDRDISQDVEALVDYIYRTKAEGGLELDLDYILPFAALPENGREIDGIDDKSELAHRIMLTNLVRLLGAVKTKKASRRFITRPTQVILPLSPNHGIFGNDGLYSESKIVRCLSLDSHSPAHYVAGP